KEGLGRMINLPLLVRGACLGTLNIGSVQTGEPEPQVLEFLQQVAIQIAFAIDHVRAYEQINRLREQLAKENEYLVEEIKLTHNFGIMLGKSQALHEVVRLADTVAPTNSTVLDRVGRAQPIPVDVLIITATNSDLGLVIAEGRFRPDLFFRLNVFPIAIPALRDRCEDIPLLARHFTQQYSLKLKRPCRDIEEDRKSTRLNSSHLVISYAVFCLKK